ncbi:MAG: sulfate ABC transporter substrate-binding protein [Nitrospiraceae bacterium]
MVGSLIDRLNRARRWFGLFCWVGFLLSAAVPVGAETRELVIASYSVPKEAYEKQIIPAFQAHWKAKTGQDLRVRSSYSASGAQTRAILGGFEADVAALSLEGDLAQIIKAGLITHDWKQGPHRGIVTTSLVVWGTRKGNPKRIKTWEDLAKGGIDVLYPNPKTSGGAMWDILAIYGAGLRQPPPGTANPSSYAADLLKRIQKNVKVMDKSGRESVTTFERGIGDVIVTYENELVPRVKLGRLYEIVTPPTTILIENPVAVVDRYADKHRVRDVAEAFVAFLHDAQAQQAFADLGFRPAAGPAGGVPAAQPSEIFSIKELGGWESVTAQVFGPQGVWTKAIEELARTR